MYDKMRAGKYVKNLSGEAEYYSFLPASLPPNPPIMQDEEMIGLLTEAYHLLGILEGISSQIPNIELFIAMYVLKEALMSSQIEGTQATLEDVLNPELDENINLDIKEVVNYASAAETAIALLKKLPLTGRLLREMHGILLKGTRGQEKTRGEFRRSQNWIGGTGSTIKTARYIPPNVEDMKVSLSSLEKYINEEQDNTDELIRIALIHYQFETIHPFLDGNGRVERFLIILYFLERGILTQPVLYISYYLKENRIEYYDRLTEVRRTGNYEQWVKFFLRALIETSDNAIKTIKELSALHTRNVNIIKSAGRASKSMLKVFKYSEEHPLITNKLVSLDLELSYSTISTAIKRLQEVGILAERKGLFRSRVYYYKEYLEILKKGTE